MAVLGELRALDRARELAVDVHVHRAGERVHARADGVPLAQAHLAGRWWGGGREVVGRWRGGGGEVVGRWRVGGGEMVGRWWIGGQYLVGRRHAR